jgi:hypothetical protein
MVMIEFDTYDLNELQKVTLPESLRQKIAAAVKMNNAHENGIVFFNGEIGAKRETRRSTGRETRC